MTVYQTEEATIHVKVIYRFAELFRRKAFVAPFPEVAAPLDDYANKTRAATIMESHLAQQWADTVRTKEDRSIGIIHTDGLSVTCHEAERAVVMELMLNGKIESTVIILPTEKDAVAFFVSAATYLQNTKVVRFVHECVVDGYDRQLLDMPFTSRSDMEEVANEIFATTNSTFIAWHDVPAQP